MRPVARRTLLFHLFLILPLLLTAAAATSGEIQPALEAYLQTLPDEAQTSVIIYLDEQADITSLDRELNREKATRQVRHERVIRALQEVATRTQPPLIAHLEEAKRNGDIAGFTPYWITNMVIAKVSKSEILRLIDRSDVDYIEPNFRFELIRPVTAGDGFPVTRGIGVTPGLKAINADRVWKELGITGAGRIIASNDTGVDGNHPALADRWRGTLPGVHWSEAWLDVVYGGTQFPVDHYSHGTHVTGTMAGLGEATGDTIGVAFGAYWIACNAIDQGVGNEFDNDVIEAFQWFADPDGDPGTVDDVPDVIQNSWRIAGYFGGNYQDCDPRWDAYIDNCEAAGTVVTFSAGNEGPGAQTLGSPANRSDTEFKNFSIGADDATNYNYPYPIASFSSRGPTDCVGSDYPIKPEVVAPGVDVYSSFPGGGYGYLSGTSMAGPHVAGIVALMREANPDLTVNEIKFIIMDNAHDFGDPGNDNTYGYGHVDAYESVLLVMGGIGYLVGTVTDAVSGDPLPADLEILGTTRAMTADPVTGEYSFVLQGDSTYTIQASYFGYDTMQQAIYVAADDTTVLDIQLDPSPSGSLAGMVMDIDNGLPIAGATVEIVDTPIDPKTSNTLGVYNFSSVPSGAAYEIQATASDYGSNSEFKQINGGELNLLALPLEGGFSDNMENGVNGWTHYNVTSGYVDQWHQSTQRNHTAGGTTSWKCGSTGGGNYADYSDGGLETPTIVLQNASTLQFWHWMDAEISSGTEAWDGGIVEISINGGPFEQITPDGGYPYTIVNNPDSPFSGGTPCFSGSHDWKMETFDLSDYSGNAVIRFRFGTDGYVTEEGWYIDDVVVAPDAPSQAVSIMLLPSQANIVIPPEGGSFEYSMALVNNTKETQIFDWWIDVSLRSGYIYGPLETHTDTLSAGESVITQGLVQEIPDWAPANTFFYNGKVGLLPGTVKAIASFQFIKSGAAAATGTGSIEDWRLIRTEE